MPVTIFLRFPDRATAISAAHSIMAEEKVDLPGSPDEIPMMGYTASGIRFDLDPVGGTGISMVQSGDTVDDLGTRIPAYVPQEGFFANMLWHGDESTAPDFGTARIYPAAPEQTFTS